MGQDKSKFQSHSCLVYTLSILTFDFYHFSPNEEVGVRKSTPAVASTEPTLPEPSHPNVLRFLPKMEVRVKDTSVATPVAGTEGIITKMISETLCLVQVRCLNHHLGRGCFITKVIRTFKLYLFQLRNPCRLRMIIILS
jgi:hypothetical protein